MCGCWDASIKLSGSSYYCESCARGSQGAVTKWSKGNFFSGAMSSARSSGGRVDRVEMERTTTGSAKGDYKVYEKATAYYRYDY
ncbi:hypothetical protein ABVK25_006525 [Lepraria finkii]|uniref:Uncharacterized protein n=1 Tax=Lepraria finkii TaxID=1340010 RepID=A0ABR4B5Z9_9LECA